MPRARCPESIEAEKQYRAGNKLTDIARSMGVPEGTVRRWKSDQDWDGKKAVAKKKITERSETSKPSVRKRGAQTGNQNGKGGPANNVHNLKHGAFRRFYGHLLTEDELSMYEEMETQAEIDRLRDLYRQHQITERRLMGFIEEIRNGAEMITHRTVTHAVPSGKKLPDGRDGTKIVNISQEQEPRQEQLRSFMEALTRVRAEMRRVADSLRQHEEIAARLRMEEEKLEIAKRRMGLDNDDQLQKAIELLGGIESGF